MQHKTNPEFIVFCGPMASAKTSRMLLALEKFKCQGRRIIVFKPAIDDRYSKSDVITHTGWKYDARAVKDNVDMLSVLSEDPVDYNVIAVDEQFMIPGSADVLIFLYRKGFTIAVSTLDLSSKGKPFDEVQKILPYATRIEKCVAVCPICGSDAHYTYRKVQDEENMVGGLDIYEPRCFTHYLAINETI
jgi:thymidine kinase